MCKRNCIIIICILKNILLYSQSVVINEAVYSDNENFEDFEGDTPDWVELYNTGDTAVNLADYQLTDDLNSSESRKFPEIILYPDSMLVVFLSGKDTLFGDELHTDFKLGLMEDSIFLLNARGEIIDSIMPACIPPGYSLARIPDGSENLSVASTTPRKTNNNAEIVEINYLRDSLTVNYSSGFYKEDIELIFTNRHTENKIVYTLNSDEPDADADLYYEPLLLQDKTGSENRFANIAETEYEPGDLISKANTVRAQVYSCGCPASNEIANTYFIGEEFIDKYNVPVVSIITDKKNLFDADEGIYVLGNNNNYLQHGKEWERPVHLEIFDSTGIPVIEQDAGIRIHGRSSRKNGQKSLRLYADSDYGTESFDYPFFADKPQITSFKRLLLRHTHDYLTPTFFKDEMCHHIVKDMDINYTAALTCVVYINGEYWGIYSLRERQDEYYIASNYDTDVLPATVISYDMSNITVEDGDIEDYNALLSAIENLDSESESFYSEVNSVIDLKELIDYYSAEIFLSNTDFPKNNLKLWKTSSDTSRWHFFFFDLDAVMRDNNHNLLSEYNNDIDALQLYPEFSKVIGRKLFQNEEFRSAFYNRFNSLLFSTFNFYNINNIIEAYEEEYTPLVSEHIYRWGTVEDIMEWKENVERLKIFALSRPQITVNQLYENFGNPYVIYPNPSDGDFSISGIFSETEIVIEIYDLGGKKEKTYTFHNNESGNIFLETHLPRGIFFIKVHKDNVVYSDIIIVY